jgi:WS/DGAT/MGAT family acyltransferase
MSPASAPEVREADAFALRMEGDPLLRSTIVAVAVLDTTPDWDVLTDRIDRATRLAPAFRSVLVAPPLRLGPMRWVADPDFQLDWHLRRVAAPAPHTLDTVMDLARTAGMTAFDPARSLWEFTLVEGLTGRRAALIMKVHHALTDGIGGIQLAEHVVDLQRQPAKQGPMPPAPEPEPHAADGTRLVRDALGGHLSSTVARARDRLRCLPRDLVGLARDPVGALDRTLSIADSARRLTQPVTRTMSPLMTERRLAWRYQPLDLGFDDLHDAGRAAGGTVNDAFMAAVAGGLSRYHDRHDRHVEELRVTMPVSLRRPGDPAGGNRITLARMVLPVGVSDPSARIRSIGHVSRRWRTEAAIPYSEVIAGALNVLPRQLTGSMLKHVDFLASDVPGFGAHVYLAGARVEGFYAFGPTIGASLNVTLMSYAGTCNIGVTTDVAAVSEPEVFTDCLAEGFEEVAALCGRPSRVGRPT